MNPPASRRPALFDALTLLLALTAYFALTLYQLHLPGLYYDEAWDAVATMHLVQGTPVELERGAHLMLGSRALPLMLDDYQGIISTYMLVPFFLLGGINVTMIRLFPILSGAIALVLCFFLARAWWGRPTARIAVLLFAVAPSWIFWSRLGVYVVAQVVPLTLGALLAYTHWWRGRPRRAGYLWLGSFLLGLGLATKLLYVWPIGALATCWFALRRQPSAVSRQVVDGVNEAADNMHHGARFTFHASRYTVLVWLIALACFTAGAFPFLVYNWQTHGTWLKIRSNIRASDDAGVNSTTVLPNLWEEVDRFRVLLDGGYFWFQGLPDHPGAANQVYKDPPAAAAFVLAALSLLAVAVCRLPSAVSTNQPPTTRPVSRFPFHTSWLVLISTLALLGVAYWQPTSKSRLLIAAGLLAVILAAGAAGRRLWAALRAPAVGGRQPAALLLTLTVASGVTWFLTGSRDPAAHGPFDLRVTDLTGILFWLSLAGLLLLLGWSRPATPWQRPLVASIGYLAAVLVQSFPTLSGLWPTHLLVMLPLPQITIAAALVGLGGWGLRIADCGLRIAETVDQRSAVEDGNSALRTQNSEFAGLRAALALTLVATLLGSALWTDYRYHRDLSQTRGLYAFSDGIYALARYLNKAPDQPVVVAEWGIRRQLEILSQGRLNPPEIFQFGGDDATTLAAFDSALEGTLPMRGARYLFTAGVIGPYRRFPEFVRVLARHGLEPIKVHTDYMGTGEPIYEVYQVQPATP